MSKVEVSKCDTCGSITENRYSKKGWIYLEGLNSSCVSEGKYAYSSWQTIFKNGFRGGADFCSKKCMEEEIFTKDKTK